jgi:ribosomal protein L11 methyltransferase
MFELVLRAPEALVEQLSDALTDALEALAVTVEDADAGGSAEQALFGEPGLPPPSAGWQRSTLRALFESEQAAEAAAAVLLAQPCFTPSHGRAAAAAVQALQAVPDEDWVRLTQAQFEPVPITPRFFIVPSWHQPPAGAEVVIRLDPGLAFGTGTHPTTRMCLRWLAEQAQAPASEPAAGNPAAGWDSVLDYGCGSGILAIAAAKLGARRVHAVDIDPAAVRATLDNAARNGVQLQATLPDEAPEAPSAGLGNGAEVGSDSSSSDSGPRPARHPLVLANILATPLKLLAPMLASRVAPGGWLVLAGILERQSDDLRQAYAPHLPIDVLCTDEGWVLMGGRAAAGGRRQPKGKGR